MSADSPRRNTRGVPSIVPPQVVSDHSIIDSVAGFINDVTLANQPQTDPKDTITWARFETAADISDPKFGDDWELEGNVAPPLLLILGYGLGVQVWSIPANGEAVEVLSWRHGIVSALRVLPTPISANIDKADEPVDMYAEKRPLIAICDGAAASGPQFCSVNFISLRNGSQVKTIKFKNPVLDILANRTSIAITFHERIAVFDARSLEDRLSVTTCFPSPGINPNPIALGTRWMAYAENKLIHSKRSGGGCDGDGVSSYTATMLNAAKSLGKGLRELGEQVAAGLTGTTGTGMSSKQTSFDSVSGDVRNPGVVTILDIKYAIKDVSPTTGTPVTVNGSDPIVAHFIAHSDAIVAMEFDNSGMMLLTADRRGHDFHVFRIQPHSVGSTLAAVHHLYVLHRGDTSAKVQNITFSLDTRWVAISTLRGTTHVFPITPYGGPAGVRTHTSLHVVNKLSRFHRSAGLTADGRSSSPISHSDSSNNFSQQLLPYHNPTMPPFPRPTVVLPLAQLRQPFTLGSPPGSATQNSYQKSGSNNRDNRQRLSSLSDDSGKPLSVCAIFAKSRSWLLDPPNASREGPAHKLQRKAVDSLFVFAGHGALIQYDLDTKLASNVAKEKICDDTAIELDVEAKAQWNLGRKETSMEIMPPLPFDNWLIKDRKSCMLVDGGRELDDGDDRCDSWLSQVEIITHAGPHRRLWMGPQFVFKTYNTPSGSNLTHIDTEAVEIGVTTGNNANRNDNHRPGQSSPLNMPLTAASSRSTVPVLIESGSYSSIEQSPKLMDRFRHDHMDSDFTLAHGESRLKEDLADAMRESPSTALKDTGLTPPVRMLSVPPSTATLSTPATTSSTTTTTITPSDFSSKYESLDSLQHDTAGQKCMSIEKVVNPLGTVTTISSAPNSLEMEESCPYGKFSAEDYVIHENCDESLFRPVVAIFCDEKMLAKTAQEDMEFRQPPEPIGNKLIVPVIEKAKDQEFVKKESVNKLKEKEQQQISEEVAKFNELSSMNKKSKNNGKNKSKGKCESDRIEVKVEEKIPDMKRSIELEIAEATKCDTQTKRKVSKGELRKSEEREVTVQMDLFEEEEDPITFTRMTKIVEVPPKATAKVAAKKVETKKKEEKQKEDKTEKSDKTDKDKVKISKADKLDKTDKMKTKLKETKTNNSDNSDKVVAKPDKEDIKEATSKAKRNATSNKTEVSDNLDNLQLKDETPKINKNNKSSVEEKASDNVTSTVMSKKTEGNVMNVADNAGPEGKTNQKVLEIEDLETLKVSDTVIKMSNTKTTRDYKPDNDEEIELEKDVSGADQNVQDKAEAEIDKKDLRSEPKEENATKLEIVQEIEMSVNPDKSEKVDKELENAEGDITAKISVESSEIKSVDKSDKTEKLSKRARKIIETKVEPVQSKLGASDNLDKTENATKPEMSTKVANSKEEAGDTKLKASDKFEMASKRSKEPLSEDEAKPLTDSKVEKPTKEANIFPDLCEAFAGKKSKKGKSEKAEKLTENVEYKPETSSNILQFFEKFTKDVENYPKIEPAWPKLTPTISEHAIRGKMKDIKVVVDYPSLTDSLIEAKKAKETEEPKSDKIEKPDTVELENIGNPDKVLEIEKSDNVEVTFTLPLKKKSKREEKLERNKIVKVDVPEPTPESLDILPKGKKKAFQPKEFPSLSLEPLADFRESLPPISLSPLDILGTKVESKQPEVSLINFESPQTTEQSPPPASTKGYPENNILFAMCGSLHYENEHNKASDSASPLTLSFTDAKEYSKDTTGEYKSLTETDEQFLSLEPTPVSTSSASEETEGSSSTSTTVLVGKKNKHRRKKTMNAPTSHDDEELRPLITSGTASMISSQVDSFTSEPDKDKISTSVGNDTPLVAPLSTHRPSPPPPGIVKTDNTLPLLDNNQASDSSSSDQANTSEDQPSEPDDPYTLNLKSIDDGGVDVAPQLANQSATPQHSQQQQSLKKKSKRRKR